MTLQTELKNVQFNKICKRCNVEKPNDLFSFSKQSKDGRFWWCKECQSKHYASNIEYRRAQNAERYKKIKSDPAKLDRWRKLSLITNKRSKEKHKNRNLARFAARYAIKCGKLIKPSICSNCGESGLLDAHHDSYEKEKWLDVRWLCKPCHMSHHRKYPDQIK